MAPNTDTPAAPQTDSMESPSAASVLYAHHDSDLVLEPDDVPTDVHTWFGLSYANYLVLPRALMQSMPQPWQHRIIACLRELDDAFTHLPRADDYDVHAVQWRCAADLDTAELAAAGVTTENDHPTVEGGSLTYFHRGHEIDPHDEVIAVPTHDPVPHYDHGRTRLQPALHLTS